MRCAVSVTNVVFSVWRYFNAQVCPLSPQLQYQYVFAGMDLLKWSTLGLVTLDPRVTLAAQQQLLVLPLVNNVSDCTAPGEVPAHSHHPTALQPYSPPRNPAPDRPLALYPELRPFCNPTP